MIPSTGAQIFNPSSAALPSAGIICVWSSACSRVSVKLRCISEYILAPIWSPIMYNAAAADIVTAAALKSLDRGI